MGSADPAAGRYPVAAAALALLLAGVFIPSPLYQYYRAHWGLTPGEISIVFAIYAGSLIPTLLFFGGVSDRLGRRNTLSIAMGIAALAALALACASNLWILLAGRVLQGISIGIGVPTATAAIREWIAPGMENRVGNVAIIAVAVGSSFGAVLGGVLAQYAPWPTGLPFATYIVFLAIMVLVVRSVPSCPHCVRAWHHGLPVIPPGIRHPFFIAAAQSFVGWSVLAIFASLVPSFVESTLGVFNLTIGSLVICLIQSGSLLAAYVSSRLSNRAAILTALVALGAGLWTLLLAVPHHLLVLLGLGVIIAGLGNGLGYVAGLNIVSAIAPPEHRAETLSALFVASYLGFSIPALAVGLAANHVGLYVAIVGAAITLGFVAVAIMLATTQHNLEAATA